MKIEEDAAAASTSFAEMPPASANLLHAIKTAATADDFIHELNKGREVHSVMGKTELCRWSEVLNRCDEILENASKRDEYGQMNCDKDAKIKKHSIAVIRFTVLLFECTSSRRIYRSMDRVLALMESADMELLAEVLRLLQTMGKRSKYLTQRLCPSDQTTLVQYLTAIAQCWGGKLRTVKMADCVKQNAPLPALFPFTYSDSLGKAISVERPTETECVASLVSRICKLQSSPTPAETSSPSETMASTQPDPPNVDAGNVASAASGNMSADDRYYLLSRVRMLHGFESRVHRVRCLVVRLLSVSTLIYCRCQTEDGGIGALLYTGFVEELVALLKAERETDTNEDSVMLDVIHTEALTTLCSIVSLEKEPKIQQILEALSAGSYHGFLSVLTRQIVDELKKNELGKPGKPSIALSTALFSFIYHLASIEPGGETLVGSGLMQTLLGVIAHHTLPIELITFGTRCARIIDLFTTIDVTAFRNNNGMEICVDRIVYEINQCRKEQPFMIDVSDDHCFANEEPDVAPAIAQPDVTPDIIQEEDGATANTSTEGSGQGERVDANTSTADQTPDAVAATPGGPFVVAQRTGLICHQQRSGLIKGLLTFVKRAIQDAQFQESIRHIMDGGLPEALMHILSNAEYYSPSLFHQSAQVITNFVYQEPDQLTALQRRHVSFVILQSLLRKELPNSRDVIGHMGTVFTALCLNERGLRQFKSYEPFDQIFRILLSVKFLVTMKKKRTEMKAAQSIGAAFDDLLRHHPTLKPLMLKSISKVLDRLMVVGNNPPEGTTIVMALAKQTARSMARGSLGFALNSDSVLVPVATNTTSTSTASNVAVSQSRGPGMRFLHANRSHGRAVTQYTSSLYAYSTVPVVENVDMREVHENVALALPQDDPAAAMIMEEEDGSDVDEDEMSMDEMTAEVASSGSSQRAAADDENIMNMDNKSGNVCTAKRTRDNLGLDMDCDDENGKRILPLGDFMLISAKIFETLLTQQSAAEMVDGFIEDDGLEKLLALCQLPCLNHEIAHSSFSQNVANIIKFTILHRNTRSTERLMKSVMNSFLRTLSPLITNDNSALAASSSDAPCSSATQTAPSCSMMMHLGEETILNSLTNLNNIMPVLVTVNKCSLGAQFVAEVRNRVWDHWLTPNGVKLHAGFRKLSRMLVWEAALIHVLKPSIRTCSTQTDPGELSATIDNAGPRTMDGGDQRADVDFCTSTDVTAEPRLPAWVVAGISTEEHAFWIQHKNIADLVVRTSKSVSDFLSVLSRSIFSTTTRHRNRRFNEYNQQSSEMFEPAKQLATMIFNSIYRDLKWTNPRGGSNTPMEYARLTELLSQMSTSLFDDRGKVAHTTLVQLFYARGCHKAFFDMFTDRLIPTLKTERHGNSGLEEVLLEWCRLASRLAIRQNMLPAADAENRILGFRQRQPFQIGASTEFDINKYLKLVHYDLFNSFTLLFEKLSSEEADLASYQNLSEMSITVFREVVSNLCPSKERPAGSGETSVALREGNLEENELRHLTLVEMGFLPEQAVQALETTGGNVDEAADLLINGGLRSREEQANERIDEASREVVRMISGREGLIRSLRDGQSTEAIARDVLNSANLADEPQNIQIPTATNNLNRLVDQILQEYVSQHVDDISVAHEAEEPPQERQIPISDVRSVVEAICHALMSKKSSADEDEAIEEPLIPPLRDLRIEQDVSVQAACIQLMPLCKRMMQIGTDMVYSCADLVASIIPALDETWRRGQLIGEMLTQEIIAMSAEAIRQPTETGIRKLATRIHFACLLFDQLAEEYIDIAQQHPLIDNLLLLIGFIDENFETNYVQNALLPTVILWLDLFDKNSRSLRRRKLLSSHTTNLAWTYLGDEDRLMGASRTKKWQPYSAKEQATINSAFFAGKQTATVRLSSGRDKEVEIDFVTMKHYDTGSNTAGMAGVSRCSVRAELPDTVNIDVEKIISEERKQAWSQGENGRLLLLLVRLLYKGFIHHVAAHSLLSFTARLTKNPENAMNFMKQGGVSAILQLKCTASGSTKALVSMIIRYCIEDELMVSQMFEKCIRAATSTHTMPIGEYLPLTTSRPKEWHETLNKLAPLTSRSPDLFLAAMERVAKMEGANMVAVPSNKLPASMPVSNERAIEVVNQFLHEAVHGEWEMNLPIGRSRMLSRASIIGVLSELVKSYAGIANIICEAKDSNGQSVMYALIENYIDSPTEKDVVSALRTLVTMIAACNHSPKAQELIVMDVKAALMSVWTTPASTQQDSTPAITPLKPLAATPAQGPQDVASTSAFGATTSTSKKITEICALIVTMCDNCPSHPATSIASNFATSRNSPAQPNHITKLFHKKKICNDLVKTITYLQLSQKESFETINQILKTLETLMKSVGVPPTQSATGTATTERRIEVGVSTDTERRDGDAAEEDEDRFQIEMILEAGVPRRAGDVEDHYDYARDRRIQNEDGQWDQEEVEEEEGSEIDESSEESGSDETVTEEDDEQNSATVRDDTAETADGGRVADVLDNNDDQDEIMDERNSFEGDDDNEADDQQEGDDGGEAEDDVEADQERPEDGDREEEEEDEDQVREEDEEEEDGDEVDSLEEEADYDDELTQNMNELEVLQSLSRHRLDFMERGYGILGQLGATADFFGEDWGLIAFRTRPTDQRESLNGLHPLLIRPPMEEASRNRTFASAQSHNSSTGGTRGSYTFLTRPTNSGQRATALGEMNQPHHLHRQNAIRRFGNAAGPEGTLHRIRNMQATNYFNRLLELGNIGNMGSISSLMPNTRTFRSPLNIGPFFPDGGEDDRRNRPSNAPTALDRLNNFTAIMEPLSIRYLAVLLNSLATRGAQTRMEEEKTKLEAIKEASAASTTAPVAEEIITASPAATATTNTMSATTARAGQSSTTTFASFAQQETGSQAGEDQVVGVPEQEGEPAEFRVVDVVTDEEPMEVGDDTSLDGTLLPHSSAATAASSVAAAEELDDEFPPQMENPFNEPSEHQAEPTQSDQQIPPEPAETRQGAAPVTESVNVEAPPAPATEEHQYRHILGDIEIPEGVDPAFLAALPEDMRADVIRDYQRQQRAERAARPPPVPEAPAEGNEQVPLVEPINPEFLQALPPELQEEVLQQHERAVRDAQEAQRRANAPPQPEPDMDGAAVIASLPANERAQVLAEMDEAELAGLPPAMQEEARRARVNHFDPTLMRYQRLLFRGGQGRPGRGGPATGPTIGQNAGNALIASTSAPQILDRDAVMTLCLLYLADTRLSYARLQKVLKNACANAATCDFVIWSLLAILEKATEGSSDDEELVSSVPPWLETMAVVGVGHNERALRMAAKSSKVLIHSMLCVPLCRNILDLLAVIAKSYPGHFLPARLRKDKTNSGKPLPAFEHFWHMVQNMSSKVLPLPREGSTNMALQLEDSPIAHLMSYLEKANVEKSSALQDRIMKVGSAIFQTLPNKSLEIMELSDTCTPLQKHLRLVVDVLTRGSCSTEGLNDGLTFIAEAMRAFSSSTADIIYEHLFTAVQHLGKQLKPQIDMLIVELDETQKDRIDEEPSTSSAALNAAPSNASAAPYSSLVVDTTGGERVTRGRFDGDRLVIDGEQSSRLMMGASSCKELQLPAVNILTDKSGAQYTLLSSLQTLVRVRTHMRQIRDDKKKKEKEEKKQREQEEEKARVAAAGGPSTEVDAEAVAAASTAVSGDPAPAPTEPSITNEGESEKPIDLEQEKEAEEPRLSERLSGLESLWNSLSECLVRLGKASDPHAVLALQPAAEAFFLVYASQKRSDGEAPRRVAMGTSTASTSMGDNQREEMDPDTAKLVEFAEKHRQVLNQALRQNNAVLSSGGPFAILTHYPKLLDFDVKRKFFRKELSKLESSYRRNDISVQVRRSQVFSDSFRELFRLRPSDWKNRFYIIFQGEEGQDAGGLLREWFSVITREIFNPNYALFITAPGDMVTYMINKASYINPEHLEYFKFVGRLIAKSVFEHKYLDCYFTRAFYKHILNLPVRYQDLESEDPAFYKSLEFLLTNPIDELGLDLTFSTEVEEFGVRSVRDLKPNGRQLEVNDANKEEYVKLVCQMKMTGSIRQQLDAFLQGFYEIIPKTLISMFNEQELELLISGLPTVDVDDLAAHTEYKSYSKQCVQIQWFWRALRSFEKEDKAKFLQFVTGTSKVPLQGFSALEGMNGVQKFSIHMDSRGGDRLPAAHTCFNQLDLPQYESYEKLRDALLLAIRECTEGFGFA